MPERNTSIAMLMSLGLLCGCQQPAALDAQATQSVAPTVPTSAAKSAAAAQAQPSFAFVVEVALSPQAAERMAQGETVIVSASYFATPRAGIARQLITEIGTVDLGQQQVELTGAGQAHIDGSTVMRDRLDQIAGAPEVNVNVYSGRHTSEDNLLACDFFQDKVAVAVSKPLRLSCRLLTEQTAGGQ